MSGNGNGAGNGKPVDGLPLLTRDVMEAVTERIG